MKSMTRVVSTGVAAALAALAIGAAPAGASTNGVGSTSTQTAVLTLKLGTNGSLLNLGLLTDTGNVNTDSHSGVLRATDSLVPITLQSPALHLDLSTPAISTLSPGGQSDATSQAITLSGLGIPPAIATATIKPAVLHSDFLNNAAHSTMTAAEVDNLTLLGGGLASVDLLSSNLGVDALTNQADGLRGVNVGQIKLIDLGALLRGIGANLTAMPVSALSGLITKLGLPVNGLAAGASLSDQVTSLSSALTGLRNQVANTAGSTLSSAVDSVTSSALGSLGLPIPAVGTLVTDVNGTITNLQNTLTGLLSNAASALDTFPLVSVSGEQAGIGVKAADTLAHSSASTLFTPLKVTVAGVPLNIDLQAVANTINGVVDSANNALNGLLTSIGLPTNLVTVKLLEKATNVSMNGNYTSAVAGLSILRVGIAAISPSVVSNALGTLTGPSISSILGSTPLNSVLGASSAMDSASGLLGNIAPLLGGAQLQVASIAGASTYTFANPPASPVSGPVAPVSLPHTGGTPGLAIIGVIFAGLALAGIRFFRMSRLQAARVTTK